jgi:hypothetical protein
VVCILDARTCSSNLEATAQVGTVMYTFTEWFKTPWDKIDVDFLAEETKKLQKDVKQLNKAVRNYEARPCSCSRLRVVLAASLEVRADCMRL